jgi:hypothetical protein
MDEITMFAALRPADPAEPGPIRERARARLQGALREPPGPTRGRGGHTRLVAGLRRHRRPVLLAGAAAVVGVCAAIAVPAILPSGGNDSVAAAAWTVRQQPDGTVAVTLNDVFDLGGLQQALARAGIPARVITVATNPATYTGPLVAVNPTNRVTVSGCFYQATGSDFEPAPVQQAVVTRIDNLPGRAIQVLYDIHPQAMPAGSVLLVQGAAIGGQGPRAAADASELASFPAPAVLADGSLPPSCTWSVIATFPFSLVSKKPTS